MLSEKDLKNREIDLRDAIFSAITLAQAEISKIRIGAAVLAINKSSVSFCTTIS
jgi:hypothetical protein